MSHTQSPQSSSSHRIYTPADTQHVRFADFPFADSVRHDIVAAGYEVPTPVQALCIPPALEGKDLFGLAQTGTGKTAAFALPIIQRLAQRMELAALVLSPTRELAFQITGVFNMLGASSGIRVATIVGGVPMDEDYKALRSWPNVLVATPGRLIDHLTYKSVSLSEIQVLAIDEADRMHDMGFIPQIRQIVSHLPQNRQTMMFTATLDAEVERVARQSMRDPVRIQIGATAPARNAEQHLYAVQEEEKTDLLLHLLKGGNDGRVLVFLRTKKGVDRLAKTVSRKGFRAVRLHGDMEQENRDESMQSFRDGKVKILLATDIAARGLDVADIEHVINYDFPRHSEDYVHRIGRTARQEASGLASSFVTRMDRSFVAAVRRLIGDKLPATMANPLAGSAGEGQSHGGETAGHEPRGRHGGSHKRAEGAAGEGQSKRRRRRRGGKKNGSHAAAQGSQPHAAAQGEHKEHAHGEGHKKESHSQAKHGHGESSHGAASHGHDVVAAPVA